MLAARKESQESPGVSLNDLEFHHSVCSPLVFLQNGLKTTEPLSEFKHRL